VPKLICLVRKDLLLVRRYLWLLLIYAVIFSGFIQSSNSTLIYGILPGMVMILAIGSDMRQSNQQFLVSLPVKRGYLVLSKYVSSLVLLVVAVVFCVLVSGAADTVHHGTFQVDKVLVLGTLVSMVLFLSVYLPLYFWLGIKGAQYLNVAMMVIILGGNSLIASVLNGSDMAFVINWFSGHPVASGIFAVGVLALAGIVSYFISRTIFVKRDL